MPAGFMPFELDAPPPGYAPQIRPRTRVQRWRTGGGFHL